MSKEQWSKVEDYLQAALVPEDDALRAATAANEAAGMPAIAVSPSQGKLLHVLARSIGARRVLEIGTLGGYSTIWLARALGADGSLVTMELSRPFAEIAAANIARAGLAGKVTIEIGDAIELLPKLAATADQKFDLTFIDADKARTADYFDWAVKLSRPGALIVVDNIVRGGRVADDQTADPSIRGVRRFLGGLGSDSRVVATAIQTVGSRGYDGLVVATVLPGAG
jgi:predicted O-methyltransferase YrrM